ncbi:MAG TPA: helix-turn-helix domain-containing protein [Pyrinomonadaceae bacterium]|nr:helix-turn-helix domain-containing protein [Pyrinomonadaceae bacterium]
MTLLPSLLRELENPNLSVNSRAELCCEAAKALEYKGEYEKARKLLSDYWTRIGGHPKLTGLDQATAGEVLLRAGVLTGAIGSKDRITEAQEAAKNLIHESLTIFQASNYRKRVAEAQTELALCYWRTGELNEARDLLKDALSRLTTHSEVMAKAVLRLAIVECQAGNDSKALRVLTDNAALFEKVNNQTLKGSYHITLGTALRHLWESKRRGDFLDRALIEHTAASYHFQRAEHKCYLANVENQLGLIYFNINRCEEAHQHLDHARRIHMRLRDAGTVAQVDETRARVFLKQGRVSEAERAARAAVYSQEKTDNHALLAEALITHGRALARLNRYGAAFIAFRRSFDLSEYAGNTNRAAEAAVAAFQEIGEHLGAIEGRHLLPGHGLSEGKLLLERDVIKRALEDAEGSVTYAARSLGISFQALTYMLNTRHKDLLKYRTPVRRRPRRPAL